MLSIERRLIDWIDEHRMLLFMVIMTALALLIRTFSLDLELSAIVSQSEDRKYPEERIHGL